MSNVTISTIQQQVKIYDSPLDYQVDVFQALETAQAEGVQLIIFPALSPLMLIPPLSSRTKRRLLKGREQTKSHLSGLVGKLVGKAVSKASDAIGGIKEDLLALLNDHPDEIYDAYIDLFSAAALKFRMTIIAGSFYLREDEDSQACHIAYVFGPYGMVLGSQQKIHLNYHETKFCEGGTNLNVINTPVGHIGILIDEDTLYPECSRILAYHGAEILINLTSCAGLTTYNQLRNAFLARVDENEVIGIQSSLVGSNLLNPKSPDLIGQSAVLQPFHLSTKGDGVVAQTENNNQQGKITQALNLEKLKSFWTKKEPQLRQRMAVSVYEPLVKIYEEGKTLDQMYWNPSEDIAHMASSNAVFGYQPHIFKKEKEKEPPVISNRDVLSSPFTTDEEDNNTSTIPEVADNVLLSPFTDVTEETENDVKNKIVDKTVSASDILMSPFAKSDDEND